MNRDRRGGELGLYLVKERKIVTDREEKKKRCDRWREILRWADGRIDRQTGR